MQRRHHYELAFEDFLRRRRIPYVAVDEARKALLPTRAATPGPSPALKSFDFVLYGDSTNLLAEVKGRRLSAGASRLECWATRDDVESLLAWEQLFGSQFEAALIFAYWCEEQPPDALFQEVFERAGRWYALRAVRVRDYARVMRRRSDSWGTVDLPRSTFDSISCPFSGTSLHAGGGPLPAMDLLGAH